MAVLVAGAVLKVMRLLQAEREIELVDGSEIANLRLNRLLRTMSDDDLSAFVASGRWVKHDEDKIVSRQGEPVGNVLFIVKGRARAEVVGSGVSPFRAVVNFLRPGDDVGILSLIDGSPHSATVTALEDILALSVPLSDLRNRLRSRDDWYRIFAEIAVQRLRTSGLWLQGLM